MTRLGGGLPKGDNVPFFTVFFYLRASLSCLSLILGILGLIAPPNMMGLGIFHFSNANISHVILFLASQDAQEVMLVTCVSPLADFTDVTLVSEDAF